jgi:hypothetical protein
MPGLRYPLHENDDSVTAVFHQMLQYRSVTPAILVSCPRGPESLKSLNNQSISRVRSSHRLLNDLRGVFRRDMILSEIGMEPEVSHKSVTAHQFMMHHKERLSTGVTNPSIKSATL